MDREELGILIESVGKFMAREIEEGRLELKGNGPDLTYHDPCRLGRQMGVIDVCASSTLRVPPPSWRTGLRAR